MEPNETILCGVCGRIVAAVGYICPRCGTNYSPIPVPIQDWPTFWQSLTPAECADALRAAPRILCEWNGQGPSGECARFPMSEHDRIAYVVAKPWTDNRCRWYVVGADGEWEGFSGFADSLDSAKSAADAALVAAGWVLL